MKNGHWSLMALVVCFLFFVVLMIIGSDAPGDDLASSYIAGRIVNTEDQSRLYNHDPVRYNVLGDEVLDSIACDAGFEGFLHPYVQTPLWALAVRPAATRLCFAEFRLLFLLLNAAALTGIIFLTAEMWAPRFRNPLLLACFLVVFVFFQPLRYTLFLSQTHPIFLFLTLLAVFLAGTGRNLLAGLVLALAAIVKISPGLLVVYWLMTGRYRASVSFLLWSAGFTALMLLTIETDTIRCYFSQLDRISSILLTALNNQSLAAFVSDLSGGPANRLYNWRMNSLPFGMKCIFSCLTLFLIIILARLRAGLDRNASFWEGLLVSGVLVATTLFMPIAWTHYFIILVIPLMVLTQHALDSRNRWLPPLLVICAVLNIHPVAMSVAEGAYATGLIVRSQFFAGFLLLALLISQAWKQTRSGDGGGVPASDDPAVPEDPCVVDPHP